MKKTNWRTTLNKDFLAAPDLDNGEGGYIETVGTITEVLLQKVKNPMGEEKVCKVAHFLNTNTHRLKPLIMNIGHCELVEQFTGSRYIEDWGGCAVQIYVKLNEKSFGDVIDACRFRSQQPRTEFEVMHTEHDRWDELCLAYKERGDSALKGAKRKYSFTDEVMAELTGK
jgi:hypothetical protein